MVAFAATSSTTCLTLDERVQRIEALAERMDGYVKFMCHAASLNGVSCEAKEKAMIAFHECMVNVEGQLSRIHDRFRLE